MLTVTLQFPESFRMFMAEADPTNYTPIDDEAATQFVCGLLGSIMREAGYERLFMEFLSINTTNGMN